MRKTSITLIMVLICIIGSFSFPLYSFASDSGVTAREVAQDATEAEWNSMKRYFEQTAMPVDEGYTRGYQTPMYFQFDCNDWQKNEYAYTGPAQRVIKSMTSSDPNTLTVNYTSNNIQLRRGSGTSSEVTITIEYQLNWAFHVKEDVAGIWWSVNDQFGSSGILTDSFTIKVAQKHLTVIPKQTNEIQLNLFDLKVDNPLSFVDYTANTGKVSYYMQEKPDDTKLGKTSGKFIFFDEKDRVPVDIPFIVVDTTPPTGKLINPIPIELGTQTEIRNFLEYEPWDNDTKPVAIYSDTDPNSLGLGNHPFEMQLTDSSGNASLLKSTISVMDSIPPLVNTKEQIIEYGSKVDANDFIRSITDNDKTGKMKTSFDPSKPAPDVKKIGIQDVFLVVSDPSGNTTKAQEKLTVNPDTIAPTGDGILQMVPVNSSMSTNPLDVVTNLQDNDDISKITAKYVKIPDTSKIGLTDAKVELSDQNGNKAEVTVPVFVHDNHSSFDNQYVLSSQNFTAYSNQVPASKIEEWILQESQSKAWELSNGNEVSKQIKVIRHDVKPQFGSYTATVQIGNLMKDITINILDAKDLIDVTIPQKVIFGSTDVQNGKVSSPSYEVKNNSTAKLKVSLAKTQVDPSSTIDVIRASDAEPGGNDEKAKLNLSSLEEFQFPIIELHPSVADQELGILNSQSVGGFQIKGAYYGKYQNTKCNIQMTFKFEAI
ncbi:hypothetical protein [Enterococcus songbeiensis]|uniref:hypothetical protein n=1 Tax=Enterococcus songbeiensis TaxID=2559927 RepID=UPI0010F515C2|nr:hypothetical protein [Enterococcus songbeiensis]